MAPGTNGLQCGLQSNSNVYAWIANAAAGGSSTLGDIAQGLLAAGLTISAAQNALNTVAATVQGNPAQLAAIQAEMQYLNTYGAPPPSTQNNWVVPLVIAGLVVALAMKSD